MDILPASATGGPISRILNGAIDGLSGAPSYLRKQAELNDFLGRTTDKYTKYCREIYRNMRILAMAKPVELQRIYTEVRIVDQIKHRQSKTEKQIIDNILQGKAESSETLPAFDVTRTTQRLVLLGRPGSGKSTFLKYFLLQQLNIEDHHLDKIPILIPLNQIQHDKKTIFTRICGILEYCGIEFAAGLAEKLLETGKFRLLIDGLDEIRQADRNQIIGEIDALMKRYRDCGFVITCRSSAYEFWFGDCHHYEIEQFSETSIAAFISKWFQEEPDKGLELRRLVISNPRLRDLCSNPLMLTIVSIGFDSGIDVSNNRAEIYKDAIDALLKRWDASRSVYRENVYKSLTSKRREDLLADLATKTFIENQVVFSDRRAEAIVRDYIATMPESADGEVIEDSRGVLNAIETQHGLIEKRALSFWVFAHLTFQEFFVARYLAARDPDLRSRVVKQFIDRPDWREVIVLTASLLPNADEFVLEILAYMARIGYGTISARRIEKEIATARRSVLHLRHDAETVLLKAGGSKEKTARANRFEVIDGGMRLHISQIREALSQFRHATGAQINSARFDDVGIMFNIAVERVDSETPFINLMEIMDGESNENQKPAFTRSRIVIQCILDKNADLEDKLNEIVSSSNIFEVTNRRYIYLLPDNIGEFIARFTQVVKAIDFSGLVVRLWKLDGRRAHSVVESLRRSLLDEFELTARKAAVANAENALKLRTLVAGETLAEILLSQVFLTPIVREAAVKTLKSFIGDPPSGSPPTPEITLRERSQSKTAK
jgi:NACHT domain